MTFNLRVVKIKYNYFTEIGDIMKKERDYELLAFRFAAFIGGAFGIYAILRYGMLSSGQTMNLLNLFMSIFGANIPEFLFRLAVALFYGFGVAIGVLIPKYTRIDVRHVSITVTAISAIILAFMPEQYSGEYISIPIFFAMALQWGAFPGAKGRASACVFLTNNVRQMIIGLTNYFCTKEKSHIEYSHFYMFTILSYMAGCGVSYYLTELFGAKSIAFVIIPVIAMFFIICKDKKEK